MHLKIGPEAEMILLAVFSEAVNIGKPSRHGGLLPGVGLGVDRSWGRGWDMA